MSDAASQPPGWYYAQGDPPGTQRYWDGTQWQGGPQPAGGAGAGGAAVGMGNKADLGARFIAFLIDTAIMVGAYIALLILVAIFGAINDTLGGIVFFLGVLGVLGVAIWNYVIKQGQTGQTVGKQQQGIKLVSDATGQPIGAGMAIGRWLLSGVINQFCLIGHIWIFIDADNKRLTDKILNANVVTA